MVAAISAELGWALGPIRTLFAGFAERRTACRAIARRATGLAEGGTPFGPITRWLAVFAERWTNFGLIAALFAGFAERRTACRAIARRPAGLAERRRPCGALAPGTISAGLSFLAEWCGAFGAAAPGRLACGAISLRRAVRRCCGAFRRTLPIAERPGRECIFSALPGFVAAFLLTGTAGRTGTGRRTWAAA
ncbi:MAG TPA: hypothetical protein VHE33_02200, partial [Acidobacteriaceae bacterium]|nr:hypothetical protein [Acidobacteriaceae bacterium]